MNWERTLENNVIVRNLLDEEASYIHLFGVVSFRFSRVYAEVGRRYILNSIKKLVAQAVSEALHVTPHQTPPVDLQEVNDIVSYWKLHADHSMSMGGPNARKLCETIEWQRAVITFLVREYS